MGSDVNVPEEAFEAGCKAAFVPPISENRRDDMRAALQAAAPAIRSQERERVRAALEAEVATSRQFIIYGTNVKQLQGEPLTEQHIVDGLIVINRGVVTRTLDDLEADHA